MDSELQGGLDGYGTAKDPTVIIDGAHNEGAAWHLVIRQYFGIEVYTDYRCI